MSRCITEGAWYAIFTIKAVSAGESSIAGQPIRGVLKIR
jgi:hypothetical protein